ncbi:hypothetical protein [Kingella potus]|nr:hypothetical protein [Kingella potus]UOP00017.1 hypothetical protein LVJ84_08350 [Kingella potus]
MGGRWDNAAFAPPRKGAIIAEFAAAGRTETAFQTACVLHKMLLIQ